MQEIAKISPNAPPPDCFGELDDDCSGGEFAKFDSANPQKLWHGRDGEASYPGPWLAVNCFIELIRWEDKKVIDRFVQRPGETLSNVDALNDAIPREDWNESPFTGEAIGPWVKNFTVHLVDPESRAKLTVSNSTVGQKIAWQTLKERTAFMRQFRGALVYPEVKLSSTSMKTHYGFKARPEFEIIGWRNFGGSTAPMIAPPTNTQPGGAVAPLTASELTGDSIDDISPPPKKEKAKAAADWKAPWDDPLPSNL